ncbi:protein kinase domain-containing protein [Chitinophaga sancti]|uniref:Lanthionine synthetase C-like protein n=1 Tax=Chitinophaga sancti TaxID=1004 RepID=A0A1K1T296_9BACT|nr:lanthionine synthetase LanC family protein [Chitinophaga sancti]WQD59579.1 lanthionine synthetase LanC family protein [Chitinophaga sancti]WQG88287.1 lanthionine synthetase LanC family protein [Chitinophaga sancti]SFW90690.1 Lanthionine synthetase C-like protein [Chitinophaga sancti]
MNEQNSDLIEKSSNIPLTNYEDLLGTFGIKEFSQIGSFLKVGNQDQSEGWIFHISVRLADFNPLIQKLFPYLIQNNLSFVIPINSDIHSMILNCHLGYINLGKVLTIFPNRNSNLSKLADELVEISTNFKGPAIPTDILLGNLVYTKYGSYEIYEPKYITDSSGVKILDQEIIPFKRYPWLSWPFKYPQKTTIIQEGEIVNGRYFIRKILKFDAKGFVMKALFQKNLFNYKYCIIKEGKMGIAEDLYGREMEDRLIWQMNLHKRLQNLIPIPKLLNFFKENSNSYLVLSYINGISFGNVLHKLFEGNHWNDINNKSQIQIIDILLKSIIIIENLHKENFVHRDINAENFLINKRGDVSLIDMELTFDLTSNYPNPPFEKGTEGYMSPEQQISAIPTFEQDIYSIGALMVKCFIQFEPSKFDILNSEMMKNKFSFFCSDADLADLMASCLELEIEKRPSLIKIRTSLEEFKNRTIPKKKFRKINILDRSLLGDIINQSISSLSTNGGTSSDGIWTSLNTSNDNLVGNERFDKTIELGFGNGISGILYLLSKAKSIGFKIDLISDTITKNINFLEEHYHYNKDKIYSGFYSGKSGIALAISSLIEANIIPDSRKNIQIIYDCFTSIPSTMEIENGIAGYGISLLKCNNQLDDKFMTKKINSCIDHILNKQSSNGSWNLYLESSGQNEKLSGFKDGISGIVWFLLNYVDFHADDLIRDRIFLALDFLIKNSKLHQGYKTWKISSKSREIHDFYNGGYKILKPFIKAYTISNEKKYKTIVEQILFSYPQHITTELFSQEKGIAGLGEIYIEAWQAFHNEEWLIRAEWIALLLANTTYGEFKKSYWKMDNYHFLNACLFNGNSGIIHFLLRIFSQNKISDYYSYS